MSFRVVGLILLVTTGAASAAESMLYVVEDSQLVFTNVPSTAARPVPGFGQQVVVGDATLPDSIYDAFIGNLGQDYGLSPALIKAVAVVESDLDPHAISPKGAMGLMQLMPATAARHGVEDPFDPFQNLRGGAAHLRVLLDEFGGDVALALAAYNAGSGAVRRANGIPDYPETRDYVRKVQARLREGPSRTREAVPETARIPPAASSASIKRLPDGTVLLVN